MLVAQRLATENFALLESATIKNHTFYYVLKIKNLLDYFKFQSKIEDILLDLTHNPIEKSLFFTFSDGCGLEVYISEEIARNNYNSYVDSIKNPPKEEVEESEEDKLIAYYVEKIHSVKFSKELMAKELKNFYLESKSLDK